MSHTVLLFLVLLNAMTLYIYWPYEHNLSVFSTIFTLYSSYSFTKTNGCVFIQEHHFLAFLLPNVYTIMGQSKNTQLRMVLFLL